MEFRPEKVLFSSLHDVIQTETFSSSARSPTMYTVNWLGLIDPLDVIALGDVIGLCQASFGPLSLAVRAYHSGTLTDAAILACMQHFGAIVDILFLAKVGKY